MKTDNNIYIEETYINETENYQCGNSGIFKTFTDNLGELFKTLQQEYGRCQSKIYVDTFIGTREVGWVFQKNVKYEDCNKYYLQSVWVILYNEDKEYRFLDNPNKLEVIKRLQLVTAQKG